MNLSEVAKSGNKIYSASKLQFSGVDRYDVYNCSIPFVWDGKSYIFGRVEKRSRWAESWVYLFEKTGEDEYTAVKDRMYQLEDPYVFIVDGELILGGTHVTKIGGEVQSFCSYFYRGTDVRDLTYFTSGVDGMKDVRLTLLANGKIGVFSRPRGIHIREQYGSESMIGFATIDSIDQLVPNVIANAEYISGIFENGQWGGCNQAYLLKNGKIGVIGHLSNKIARTDGSGELLSYKNIAFVFNPEKMQATHLHVIATRSDYPEGPSKKAELEDCAFTSGIEMRDDGKVNLYSGIGDCEEGRVVIDDPFAEEGGILACSDGRTAQKTTAPHHR